MKEPASIEALSLPPEVKQALRDWLSAAEQAFGPDLRSVVLYGSAAEGKLRRTSDVNVIVVLAAFEQSRADRARAPARVAQAAVQLRPMYLLEGEIEEAAQVFAQKFADLLRRRVVLYGEDPFAGVSVPRDRKLFQVKQQILNLTLRLRAFYVLRSLREEQIVAAIADAAGPLRSCAAALLELEGQAPGTPKEALDRVAALVDQPSWRELLALVSTARETRSLPVGAGSDALFRLIELARRMYGRVTAMRC